MEKEKEPKKEVNFDGNLKSSTASSQVQDVKKSESDNKAPKRVRFRMNSVIKSIDKVKANPEKTSLVKMRSRGLGNFSPVLICTAFHSFKAHPRYLNASYGKKH